MTSNTISIFITCVALLPNIGAAPATKPANATPTDYLVSRLDVLWAYARLDRALVKHPPQSDADRDRINHDADEATRLYYRRDYAGATRALDALTESISPELSKSLEARVARSMRVRVGPRVAVEKRPAPLRAKLTPAYPVDRDRPVKLKFVISYDDETTAAAPAVVFTKEITIETNGLNDGIMAQQPKAPEGRYRIDLVAPDGSAHRVADWFVGRRSMNLLRQENDQRKLSFVRQTSYQIAQATTGVSARNLLLADQLTENDLAGAISDPIALADSLDREIKELQEDRDPFVDRAGDYWRTIVVGTLPVPARIYAPNAIIGKRAPLVIVLPGIGGDETGFMESGAGRTLKKLADDNGLLVAVVRPDIVASAAQPIDDLIRAMGVDYLIDESRIYTIGYAGGAPIALDWAGRQANRLTGVCTLASVEDFRAPAESKLAPTLVVAGALDPLAPMPSQKAIDDAKSRGLPIELKVVPHTGHTLLPIDALPDAIKWLLAQPPRPAK